MEPVAKLMSLESYATLDEPDDRHVTELVGGMVVREPRPGRLHGRIQVRLGHALQSWADAHGRAEVTAESGYILADEPAIVRGPDVALVLDPRPTVGEPGGWTRGAPDLAVEVLSPSDSSSMIQQKTLDYLETGARIVWIVDPVARTVTTYRPDGSARLLRADETLDGEDLLPGFTLPLATLFGP